MTKSPSANARDGVLGQVRAACAKLAVKRRLPDVPMDVARPRLPLLATKIATTDGGTPPEAAARFCERLLAAHGQVFTEARSLGKWLAGQRVTRGVCDPDLAGELGSAFGIELALDTTFDRDKLDEYGFGITRAAGAIAETGTIILTDGSTSSRLAALTPWIHVAVVRVSHIHATVADALSVLDQDPFAGDPNVIWCTGPSKTADVEGILIEGVHGPGIQVALLVP